MRGIINKLEREQYLTRDEFKELILCDDDYLFERARYVREQIYNKDVYMRGLIEFTNYCKNDCNYCGIRRSNKQAERYRLNHEQIMDCCRVGYELGFRTFVLQGGEDPHYSVDDIAKTVRDIRQTYSDCAITLSFGEHNRESYEKWFEAGADRYLLRHETANDEHYRMLHPQNMSLADRKRCLWNLKEIGYQVGCGFMVGSPFQTIEYLVDDLVFIHELQPHMVGIGPFIPHAATPYKDYPAGDLKITKNLLAILRLMQPNLLLPATTALGTIDPQGRELGIMAGANVVMPNLSPIDVREKYMLYDNKICTGDEAAECRLCIAGRIQNIGYKLVESKGDYKCTT